MKQFNLLVMTALLVLGMTAAATAQSQKNIDWRKQADNKKATFYQVQADFNKYWNSRTPTKGTGYNVFKRWEKLMEPRVFPSGDMRLPSTDYENFMEWQRMTPQTRSNPAATANFTSLGPFDVPEGYDAGAGRVDFIRFDPNNSDIIYVGAPDGGLWKSINGGSSWSTNTDFLPVIGCSDLVIDPNNTQIMYLATGNWESDRHSIGVLKTINGGTTWSATSLVWSALDNYEIRGLIMDPNDSDIMMVATDGGVFRTTDGWMTHQEAYCCNTLYDIHFKPGNSNIVYAAGTDFWKSIDNGENWNQITSGLPSSGNVSRTMLAVTIDNPNYVYAIMGDNNGGLEGVYRSTNSGTTFSKRTNANTPNLLNSEIDGDASCDGCENGQATHDLAIIVAPDAADVVTIGGINQWRSLDGGATWVLLSYWLGNDNQYPGEGESSPDYTHADIQDIQYLPGSSTVMFTTCDGGVNKSIDDGVKWSQITNNLTIGQQNGVAMSVTDPTIVVNGLQDIGTIKKSGSGYSIINGGDGESSVIDYTNHDKIITSNPNGNHDLSLDGGPTRNKIEGGLPAGLEFYSHISQDPVNALRYYAGGRHDLWVCNNFVNHNSTWTKTGASPPLGAGNVLRFVVANSNNNVIYATKSNRISKSTNAGSTWTNVTGTIPTGSAQPTNIEISNVDENKVWVTLSGYSDGNKIFKTTDGGSSWTNISDGLPNLPFNTIVHVNNAPKDDVYAGGDIGIYYRNNDMSAWTIYNTGLPNCKVTDLQIYYPPAANFQGGSAVGEKLRAATYGRGTWESDINDTQLPVELYSFSGENRKEVNILQWKTVTELNLDRFAIERSVNGEVFEEIGNVRSNTGNSFDLKSYTFTDPSPAKGLNYYRLKVIDIDDKFDFSHVLTIYVDEAKSDIVIYPNPATNYLEVKGLPSEGATAQMMNALGRILWVQKVTEKTPINVSHLPNGTYYLEVQSINGSRTVKSFIKQ